MQRLVKCMAAVAVLTMSAAPANAMFFNKKCGSSACSFNDCCGWSGCNGGGGGGCNTGCGQPATHTVQKTVMVPTTCWETRQVKSWECFPVCKDVPVTCTKYVESCEPRTCQVTEYQRVQKTRTVNVKVCKPITTTETRQVTVMVPHQETRQGCRTECKRVCHTEMKTVTKDCGHWETQCVPCGHKRVKTCCGCECVPTFKSKRVWVPNCVTETVPVTCWKTESVQVPYTYCVTVCKPECRTETYQCCKTIEVCEPRTECYTECVPVCKTVTHMVKVCKPVTETVMQKVTSYERREVCKEVKVAVCKMVPQTITVCEPACGGDCGHNHGGCGGCGHDHGCGCDSGCGKKGFSFNFFAKKSCCN